MRGRVEISNLVVRALTLWVVCVVLALGTARGSDRQTVVGLEKTAVKEARVWELNSMTRAVVLLEQAADAWLNFGEYRNSISCLHEASQLVQIDAGHEAAFRLLQKALQIANSHNLHDEKILSLSMISLLYFEKGEKELAEKYYERAHFLIQNSTSRKAVAYALFSQGMFQYYHATLAEAISTLEKAESNAKNTEDIYLISQVLTYLSYSYLRVGRPAEAEDKMNLVLSQCEKHSYSRGTALAYFGIAFVRYFTNDKQAALDLFKKSNSLFPLDFEWLERARILNAIAQIYLDFGELEISESLFLQSIPYYEKAHYPLGKLTTLTTLSELYTLRSDLDKARRTYQAAITLSIELGDRFRLAIIKEGLGGIEFRNGNYDLAIGNYNDALRTYNEIGVKFSDVDNLLGNTYEKKGDHETALRFYRSALAQNHKTNDLIQMSENLGNIARVNLVQGNMGDAFSNIEESIATSERLFTDVPRESLKRAYYSSIYTRYELYRSLFMQKHKQNYILDFAIRALQANERSRSRSLSEMLKLTEANFTADANPDLIAKEKQLLITLDLKANRLTELLSTEGENVVSDNVKNEIRLIEQNLDELRAELKQSSPIYSAIKNPEPFDVGDFQANVLGEDDLLLEFSLGTEESYLWTVDKREVAAYYLPARGAIEARVEKLRQLLSDRQLKQGESFEGYQKRIADAEVEYRSEARALSDDLLGQITSDKLAGKKLIVVADGRLHYFALGSLPMPGTEDEAPILLTNEVVYAPSASTLKILRMKKEAETRPEKDLLVFADPVFSRSDERIAGLDSANTGFVATILSPFRSIESLASMPRLPASREEAQSISDVVGRNQTSVRAGFAANRDGVLNGGIEDYKILHFATHGLIDEKRPELSGILLSLYDNEGKANDGGFIRLQDVYGMRLNSDLVVLSACDTGIGKEIKGEGVMSLNNAFLQAGARSVVSSLWKVDDNATKDLMTGFYRGMADDNLTAAAALRQAQIKMYRDPRYRSPFYWAAFTASGDTDVRVAFTSYAWLYALIAAGFVLAAIVAFVALRRRSRRPKFPAQ